MTGQKLLKMSLQENQLLLSLISDLTGSITFILIGAIILGFILIASMIKVVPQRTAIIVERLGKFRAVYTAGFQVLIRILKSYVPIPRTPFPDDLLPFIHIFSF